MTRKYEKGAYDWVTTLYEATELARFPRGKPGKEPPPPGDPELIDALHAYIGRLGLIVGPYRDAYRLDEHGLYVMELITKGLVNLSGVTGTIPNGKGWRLLRGIE